jgi:hypothetical protein
MTYASLTVKLTVTKTGNKRGLYHYQVVEKKTDKVLAERHSNRKYVAATLDGGRFFGRLELAAKDAEMMKKRGVSHELVNGYYAIIEDVKAFDEHE